MSTGKFEDLAKAPRGEGILSMTMDTRRSRLYGLTWPTGYFIYYDLAAKALKDLGPTSRQGENGKGDNYRTLCRSLVANPEDGSVYFTTGDGDILRYRYLFRFDPSIPRVDVLDRVTSLPSKRSGMFDQFSYGYLGFALGPDGNTLHYITGGPVYVEGKRVTGKKETAMGESKGIENLHLVTYHIPTGKYTDHGPIFFANGDRPAYVNSIAVGKDGTVYTLSRITENGRTRTDLISIARRFRSG
jgi:hypothetical protein